MAASTLSLAQNDRDPAALKRSEDLAALAEPVEGGFRVELGVEGVHCARCISLIENTLAAEPEVRRGRVNFSTRRLVLDWQGERTAGARLLAAVTGLGYTLKPLAAISAAPAEDRMLLRCLAAAGFAMANIMLISIMLWATGDGEMGPGTKALFHWVSAAIALPAVVYAGRPFFRSALAALRAGRANMDVPISLAVILASALSVFETINHGAYVYFDSAVMLLFFLLIGRYLDARAKGEARRSAQSLMTHFAGTAEHVLDNGSTETLAIRDLRAEMRVRVRAGDTVPADGVIARGRSDVDMSLITGESLPVAAGQGDKVYGGTSVLNGLLEITVTKASSDSLLSEIVRLMELAEQGHSRYVRLADRAARIYTPLVHSLAALAFLGWWGVGGMDWQAALITAISVLIITCPCALGLAVPVVQVLTSSWLFKRGILLKSGDALERLAAIRQVVYDKTGTLTLGTPNLVTGSDDSAALALAASLAQESQHPLCRALVAAAEAAGLEIVAVSDVQEHAGEGMTGIADGVAIRLGRKRFAGSHTESDDQHNNAEMWLARPGLAPHRFTFADRLRPDAASVTEQLRARGLDQSLLSGDRLAAAQAVADRLALDSVAAERTPTEKVAELKKLEAAHGPALMVGDGLNDAAALTAASVSMSPSTALDISQQSADLVFQGEGLAPVAAAHAAARVSTRLVYQNFALAVAYNAIAIPIALAGYVTPLVAAVAMSSSSLLVIANAFRLSGLLGRQGYGGEGRRS